MFYRCYPAVSQAISLPQVSVPGRLELTEIQYLHQIKPDVESGSVSAVVGGEGEQQLVATILIDPVGSIPPVSLAFAGIRLLCVHLVGQVIIEEKLRGELIAACRGGVSEL